MAIRACSLNNSSSTTLFSNHHALPSKPCVQIPSYSTHHSPCVIKHNNSHLTVSENSLIIAAMAEAITLANAAAQAAKDAVSLTMALRETISMQTREDEDYYQEHSMVSRRRRRRRKRSREDEFRDWDSCSDLMRGGVAWSERSRYLTRRQEGEFSSYIKVKFKPEKMDDNRKEPCLKLHQLLVGQRKDLMKRCCWELESAEKGSPSATRGLSLPLQRHTRAKDWASRTSSRFTSCSF